MNIMIACKMWRFHPYSVKVISFLGHDAILVNLYFWFRFFVCINEKSMFNLGINPLLWRGRQMQIICQILKVYQIVCEMTKIIVRDCIPEGI